MNKVKEVSDIAQFTQLNRKYINIYSKIKNNKQYENNLKVRNDLINEIVEYNKLNPIFRKTNI